MRRVPQGLEYSSRPKARTAHVASGRLADENPLFEELRNLAWRCAWAPAVGLEGSLSV